MLLSLPGSALQGGAPFWTNDLAKQIQVGYGGLCFGVALVGGKAMLGRSDLLSYAAGLMYPGPEYLTKSNVPGRGIKRLCRAHLIRAGGSIPAKLAWTFAPEIIF